MIAPSFSVASLSVQVSSVALQPRKILLAESMAGSHTGRLAFVRSPCANKRRVRMFDSSWMDSVVPLARIRSK